MKKEDMWLVILGVIWFVVLPIVFGPWRHR